MKLQFLSVAGLLCLASLSRAADAAPGATNVMRQAAVDQRIIEQFIVEPGFRLELAAAAPMVCSPVAMAFDESGRLFVVEMRDYPNHRNNEPHLGRIRLLEEPNEDGVYQTSTVFADNLPLPSAIACYGGGVFVAAAPDILYYKATRSGGADVNQVVLTGFGGEAVPAADRLPNNFNWGPDDRIHAASAGIGGTITSPGWGGGRVVVDGADFSFNPRTLAIVPEAGAAQSGLCFDNFGHEFGCDFGRPLRQNMYELAYRARNPFYPAAPPMRDIASPATPVFRFNAAAAEAAARLPGRTAGQRDRLTNGVTAAWLSQARGVAIYRGNTFPTNYVGNAFIADRENHLIHRVVLGQNGLDYVAERAANERSSEFLIGKDDAFWPEQIVNGPDGALYIADLETGGEHGRIFRVVPMTYKRAPAPQLGQAKTTELVTALAHPNGWHRDTAARLLFEREDPAALPLLAQMAERARSPVTRIHALRALAAAGAFNETNAVKLLHDPDPQVRETAVQLCARLISNGMISSSLWEHLRSLASDGELRVRCQVAFAVGSVQRADKVQLLAEILSRDLRDPYVQNAVLSSAGDTGASLLAYLVGNAPIRRDPAGGAFLRQLALMVGMQGRFVEVTGMMNFIVNNSALDWGEKYALLAEIGEGLHRTRSSFALVDPQNAFQGVYSAALSVATSGGGPESLRVDSVRFLAVSPYGFSDTGDWLTLQCTPQPFPRLQLAALNALGRYDDPRVLTGLLGMWQAMTPALRQQAVTALLSRANRVGTVLEAIEKGRIPAVDVNVINRNLLRTYPDPGVSQRAVALFGPVLQQRPEVVQRFKGALRLRGGPDHGRQIYQERCAGCHQPDASGTALGPTLAGARTKGREKLLELILEPNANVSPEYAACVVQTKDGELLVGIKTEDNPVTLTLRQPAGPAVWPRLNVSSAQTQSWSLMPDGLEGGLEPQDMADLVDYLMTFDVIR